MTEMVIEKFHHKDRIDLSPNPLGGISRKAQGTGILWITGQAKLEPHMLF